MLREGGNRTTKKRRAPQCNWCSSTVKVHRCKKPVVWKGSEVPCGNMTCEGCLTRACMNGSPENRILPFRDKMDEDCFHCHAFLKCECYDCQSRTDGALTVGDFADCGCQEFVTVLCCQGVRDGKQCCNQRFFVKNVGALHKSIKEAEKEDYDVSKIKDYKGCIHDAKRFNRVGCMETGCCMSSSGTSVMATTNENRGEIPLASRFATCYTDLFADAGDDVLKDDADGDADSEADLSEEESEGSEEWSSASSDSPVSSPESAGSSSDDNMPLAKKALPEFARNLKPLEERKVVPFKFVPINADLVDYDNPKADARDAGVHDVTNNDDERDNVPDLFLGDTGQLKMSMIYDDCEDQELYEKSSEGRRAQVFDKLDEEKERRRKTLQKAVLKACGQKKGKRGPSRATTAMLKTYKKRHRKAKSVRELLTDKRTIFRETDHKISVHWNILRYQIWLAQHPRYQILLAQHAISQVNRRRVIPTTLRTPAARHLIAKMSRSHHTRSFGSGV